MGVSPRPIRTSSRTRSRELQASVIDDGAKISLKDPSVARPSKGKGGPFIGPPGRTAKSIRKPARAKPTKPPGDATNVVEVLLGMGTEQLEVFDGFGVVQIRSGKSTVSVDALVACALSSG